MLIYGYHEGEIHDAVIHSLHPRPHLFGVVVVSALFAVCLHGRMCTSCRARAARLTLILRPLPACDSPANGSSVTGDYRVARAAFEEAVKRRPGRIVTLRQKTRVLADSRKRD